MLHGLGRFARAHVLALTRLPLWLRKESNLPLVSSGQRRNGRGRLGTSYVPFEALGICMRAVRSLTSVAPRKWCGPAILGVMAI